MARADTLRETAAAAGSGQWARVDYLGLFLMETRGQLPQCTHAHTEQALCAEAGATKPLLARPRPGL